MKIVIAPDSFKESLTALEVANAIETGFKRIFPNAVLPSPDKPKKLFTWLPNGAVTSVSIKRP